jgi:hemoglobin
MNQSIRSLYDRIGGRQGLTALLWHFYADVRQHDLVGPIFNRQIEDWPAHLAKIGEFWARITGGPSNYFGQMPAKHFGLGIDPRHFVAWLGLWDCNCRSYLNPQEAQEMSQLAHEIGRRLRSIIASEETAGIRLVRSSHRHMP